MVDVASARAVVENWGIQVERFPDGGRAQSSWDYRAQLSTFLEGMDALDAENTVLVAAYFEGQRTPRFFAVLRELKTRWPKEGPRSAQPAIACNLKALVWEPNCPQRLAVREAEVAQMKEWLLRSTQYRSLMYNDLIQNLEIAWLRTEESELQSAQSPMHSAASPVQSAASLVQNAASPVQGAASPLQKAESPAQNVEAGRILVMFGGLVLAHFGQALRPKAWAFWPAVALCLFLGVRFW
jgi:hypothetical protein